MAIFFKTDNPANLLADFKKKIDQKSIVTWSYDNEGDFTHTPPQWIRKAWLRPEISSGQLIFYILGPKGTNLTTEVYAIFHGRFIEAMLVHCDRFFSRAEASAMPTGRDQVAPSA